MEEELMDKTYFKKQSFNSADMQVRFWRSQSIKKRLQSAYHLSLRVYGYDPADPPKMDKTYDKKRKRNK